MGMNPDTNRFEELQQKELLEKFEKTQEKESLHDVLLRPDGSPVPKHWSIFSIGEVVVIKDYTFCVQYIGETAILFEPIGPVEIKASDAEVGEGE